MGLPKTAIQAPFDYACESFAGVPEKPPAQVVKKDIRGDIEENDRLQITIYLKKYC